MLSLRRAISGAAAGLICACDDGTGPEGDPGLQIVAGATATDTIGTELTQALIAELRDDRGNPIRNHVLRFSTARIDETDPSSGYNAAVSHVNQNRFDTFVAVYTDNDGRARVMVKLGGRAGPARVIVTDPDQGVADTATYTVQPGNAVRVAIEPRDTAVYVGRTATLRETVFDREGNARSGTVTRSVVGSAASRSGDVLTGVSVGTALVVVSMGTVADTTFVSVPPEGTIAAFTQSGLATVKTDGSDFRVLVPGMSGLTTAWSPSGAEVAFDRMSGPLQVVTVANGAVRLPSSGSGRSAYPEYSRNGQWIFYSRETEGWRLYRVHPDGTNDEIVPMQAPEADAASSPSPDGSKLVYTLIIGAGDDHLLMLDMATGASTDLDIIGHQPAWSPNGNHIAFVSFHHADGAVKVMNPNGTGVRAVGVPGDRYGFGLDWSPDSQWIIAHNESQGRVDLINPTSGQIIPLGFARSYNGASWKP